ncbi:helicase related [Anaeramoeba flamelloides]|uniref:Helicase related n=1 Tax=Anaeramoeba flamelloides TaxID=1746091 RepID=A0ABQ8YJP1_9EUKA|nr:helicase related [Anaeramoeba flamelloides]
MKKFKNFNLRFFHHFLRDYFLVTIFLIVLLVGWPLSLIEWPEKYGKDDLELPKGYESDKYVMDHTTDRLLTFVQLSDTHLGFSNATEHKFERYLSKDRLLIKPNFHVLTGDITDGYNRTQHESDWILYQQILEKYDINKDLWFDVQGNHDIYGILNQEDEDNYYYQYNPNKDTLKDFPRAYKFSYKAPFGTYDFLSLNFVHFPNPEYPYGLFGTDSVDLLDRFEEITDSKNVNQTFILSHYPIRHNLYSHKTSNSKKSMFDLLQEERIIAYLSGHIHSYENYLQKLDSKTNIIQASALALKWKDYRIVSIDNDIINFIETNLYEWPKILPTNPKNALFISKHEPLERIRKSTHIRALIYEKSGDSTIESVQVKIDDKSIGYMTRPINKSAQPLWVMPWNAQDYEGDDLHNIKYIINFNDGSKPKEQQHNFSVVGQQESIKFQWRRDFKYRTNWNALRKPVFWIGFGFILIRLFLFSKILISFIFSKTFISKFQNNLFDTLDSDQYNLFQSIILHFKITFWRHVQLSNLYWFYLCALAIFSIALPSMIFKVANNRAWLIVWLFRACAGGNCTEYTLTYFYASVFTYFVFLPALELIVDLEIINKEESPNYMTERYIIFRSLAHIIVFLFGSVFIVHVYSDNIGPTGYLLSIGQVYVGLLLLIIAGYLLIKWVKNFIKKTQQIEITV